MLVERLRSEPDRALFYAQALQSMNPTDEQVALELRSLNVGSRKRDALGEHEVESSTWRLAGCVDRAR
jgi:hypothetical protein